MSDPYVYKDTKVLINKSGIKTEKEYQIMEALYSTKRFYELEKFPSSIKGDFDFDHLKSIHGYLFQDVWDWAGEARTVIISKNEMFAMPQYIDSFAKNIFKDLQKNNYFQGLDKNDFAKQLADVLGDISAMHPFREGNGRAQRHFISQIANNAGYHIDWSKIGEKEMVSASVHSMNVDNTEFRSMFDSIIVPVESTYENKKSTIENTSSNRSVDLDSGAAAADSSKSVKTADLVDEAVNKADEAEKAAKAAKLGKLGLLTSVGATAVVAAYIDSTHSAQRETAEYFLKTGLLKPDAYKAYIELNRSVEKMMQAENIAGQGWLFVVTTPIVESKAANMFSKYSQKYNLSPQVHKALGMSMLDGKSTIGKFADAAYDAIPNKKEGAPKSINGLIDAKNAVDKARLQYTKAELEKVVEMPAKLFAFTINKKLAQPVDLSEAKQNVINLKIAYTKELQIALSDPGIAKYLINKMPKDVLLDMTVTTARRSRDKENVSSLVKNLGDYQEKLYGLDGKEGSDIEKQREFYQQRIQRAVKTLSQRPDILKSHIINQMSTKSSAELKETNAQEKPKVLKEADDKSDKTDQSVSNSKNPSEVALKVNSKIVAEMRSQKKELQSAKAPEIEA